jgi:hypothetical protein
MTYFLTGIKGSFGGAVASVMNQHQLRTPIKPTTPCEMLNLAGIEFRNLKTPISFCLEAFS